MNPTTDKQPAGRWLTEEAKRMAVNVNPRIATFLVQPTAWTAIVRFVTEPQQHQGVKTIISDRRMLCDVPVTIVETDPTAPLIRLVIEPPACRPGKETDR